MGSGAPLVRRGQAAGYSQDFNATSAASAIIAGAAILVQDAYHTLNGVYASPAQLRSLLSDPTTGTPSDGNGIGVMPNVGKIVAKLKAAAKKNAPLAPAPPHPDT